ncbi:hypothetical protein C942_02887 [Photobacterium marinum]|uniref:Outer membrane protein beta-barrel domain-containing protein n=1 Tax=Photobacterium marinum TaxID=1056511 RepID=L8J652_9GAMM|nr:hypothetical protein [Photobacterium marinum]ELR64305.1 hypothetical protein C942_02887 [Photobacterium marinum]
MIKKAVLISTLLALPMQAAALTSPLTAGVFLGSPTSGLTVQYRDDYKFAVGFNEPSFSVDAIWNASDMATGSMYSPLYGFTGIQWVDDSEHEWGPRGGVGIVLPYHYVHMYAEAGVTWYMQKESSMEVEGAVGVRFNL